MSTATPEPLLRTLSPLLRRVEVGLRTWLEAKHVMPLSIITNATLEGMLTDLRRQADTLDVDRPLLTIMLMGGTGVGKSTLLNALAGGAIAQASFARPTTRDPVVYYHESLRTERLDPALRMCHLATHDRTALEHKVLVDTPDVDSNDLANRDKLIKLLPIADIVLYVGSQEKYHDDLGWELFKDHRKRRAFAFVLNKWDRCLQAGAEGLRPDDDWLRDLKSEGFESPIVFRTNAQYWVDKANNGQAQPPPDGEQFVDLVNWLEMGLTRMEIEAIKARGVSQLLQQLQGTLESSRPPELAEAAEKTRRAWEKLLGDEAQSIANILLNTLEPFQREIEHHFTVESHRRFRGLMAGYLNFCTKIKYVGTTMRSRMALVPKLGGGVETQLTWDVARFTSACSAMAGEKHLDARNRALADRLLVEADQQQFPLVLLNEPTENAARLDWRNHFSQALVEVLGDVEQHWSRPSGLRRFAHSGIIFLGNTLPPLALFGAVAVLLWQWFMLKELPGLSHLIMALIIPLLVMVLLQVIINWVLPLRWHRIRSDFQEQLEHKLKTLLTHVYAPIPGDRADALREERKKIEKLQGEVKEVATWLEKRQQAASIAGLYGK